MDSFDGSADPECAASGSPSRRQEFVVSLAGDPEAMLARCNQHHRRHIRRGDRSGWTVRRHDGAEGARLLELVQDTARGRADRRGASFAAASGPVTAPDGDETGAPWGTGVFAAWDGDALLAAKLVGWGGRRVYYIAGGSTTDGYSVGASAWLQWRIALTFAAAGYAAYNLGGAGGEGAAGEGLRRFKQGFGAQTVERWGARWRLRPLHVRGHDALNWHGARSRQ